MKNFLKKNLNYLLLALIVIALAVTACFGIYNTNSLSSSYDMEGETEENYHTVVYEVEFESGYKINSVYVNFASLDRSSAEVFEFGLSCCISKTGKFSDLKKMEFANNYESVKPGEWHLVRDGLKSYSSYKFLNVFTKADIKINEIAVVGSNDEGKLALAKMHFVGAGDKADYKVSINKSSELKVTDDIKAKTDKLFDEQAKFDLTKIMQDGTYANDYKSLLTYDEYNLADTIDNVLIGNDSFVKSDVNPLGVYILSIGTSLFGYSPLGMRIMPTLFTLFTVVLLFFLGSLLTKKQGMGLLFSFLYAVCTLSLGFATVGGAFGISLFFTVFAFYTLIKFYKKGISNKNRTSGLLNILLGGISFAISVAVQAQAVIYLLPFAIIFVLGMLRMNGAYKAKRAEFSKESVEYAKITSIYTRKAVLTSVLFAVSYILITFILLGVSLLLASKAYLGFYGKSTIFGAMLLTFKNGLVGNGTHLYPLGHIINFNGEYLGNVKYLIQNIVVACMVLVSILGCAFYSMRAYVKGDKNGIDKQEKKLMVIPFIFLVLTFACGVVYNQVANLNSLNYYYVPSVMGIGMVITLVNYLSEKCQKVLFEVCGLKVTLVGLIVTVLCILALASFALSIPAVLGLSSNFKLFAFNVFGNIL